MIEALEDLLEQARAGKVVGLAYVAMHSSFSHTVDIAGANRRYLSLTRGQIRDLDDAVSDLIRQA